MQYVKIKTISIVEQIDTGMFLSTSKAAVRAKAAESFDTTRVTHARGSIASRSWEGRIYART